MLHHSSKLLVYPVPNKTPIQIRDVFYFITFCLLLSDIKGDWKESKHSVLLLQS